jgi:putative nucleotidyltransferase with HDIG domain
MRIDLPYRAWQFFQSLKKSPGENDLVEVRLMLNPAEMDLFQRLPVPDQNHSLSVYQTLRENGEEDPDLLKAALLHDLGKTRFPLRRWERVIAVLLLSFFPRLKDSWGNDLPTGFKKPVVVIIQHPAWGAELAQQAGSSDRTVWLIKNHEMHHPAEEIGLEDLVLLKKLQEADSKN